MRSLIISRWDDIRILPSIHICAQIDAGGKLQKHGAIVFNWLYWSVAYPLVDLP